MTGCLFNREERDLNFCTGKIKILFEAAPCTPKQQVLVGLVMTRPMVILEVSSTEDSVKHDE